MSAGTRLAKPWIVVVGGFLGSGKTSLILAAAEVLSRRGMRCAVITNDQGDALVDSAFASHSGLPVGEVQGGCFCCRFSELQQTVERLAHYSPDVIFAEPVGSCTDIAATTIRPLLESSDKYRVAPFTVLVDPARAAELNPANEHEPRSFLFRKQIEEADLVCFTKSDLDLPVPDVGLHTTRRLSALTGQGVAAWLDEVLCGTLTAGQSVLDIDYRQYAEAEAALAWLNLQADLHAHPPQASAMLVGPLMDDLDRELTDAGIAICHLKLIVTSASGFLKAAICANAQEPTIEGEVSASPESTHRLIVNLRAVAPSGQVRGIVEKAVSRIDAQVRDLEISCFHPGAPVPERRIAASR
jgi:hypothetical protein